LFISRRTAEHHRANIMGKLNVRKVTDLVRYALKKGYVQFQGGFFPSRYISQILF
jgi:DNA-binding NarL/FixJ family response regulator